MRAYIVEEKLDESSFSQFVRVDLEIIFVKEFFLDVNLIEVH